MSSNLRAPAPPSATAITNPPELSQPIPGLLEVLAPDVVLVTDGGGLAPAARKPIAGVEKVLAFLRHAARFSGEFGVDSVWLNGTPGARIDIDGEVAAAVSLTVENGRVTGIYAIRNPHKLAWLDAEAALAR